MASDMEILQKAADFEEKRKPMLWRAEDVGAQRTDINRLTAGGFIELKHHSATIASGQYSAAIYRLTDKGREAVEFAGRPPKPVTAAEIMDAMSQIIGFEDLKDQLAYSLTSGKRANFLLKGPPACGKSVLMDAIANVVPDSYMAFGSRTSGAGLSDILFEKKPRVLLLDEVDKLRGGDVVSLLLGLMAKGIVIETKKGATRSVGLNTIVIAACNSWDKLTKEFKSRFAMKVVFPEYTREEFITVVRSTLVRIESLPPELAELIGATVYDNKMGDVRAAMGVGALMKEPTEAEAVRVMLMQRKYSENGPVNLRKQAAGVLI